MKNSTKRLALSIFLSASVLGACASPPASNPTPAALSKPATSSPPASANSKAENDLQVKVARITEKVYNNEAFSKQLKADPKAVLTAEGLSLSADDKVRVVDLLNESGKAYLILDDRNLERFYGPQLKNSPTDAEAEESLKTMRALRAKAQTDAKFKASLLADPATVLVAEGFNADAAKNFEVLDYEADTHYFLLMPPDQQISRDTNIEWCDVENPLSNPFCPAPLPWLIMLNLVFKTMAPAVVNDEIKAEVIDLAANAAYGSIEATCFWPRIFGASCGVPKDTIKQGFYNAVRLTTDWTILE